MKKILILLPLFLFLSVEMLAQSSMSDEQVAQFVMEQHEKGTSSTQIVTQLMQRGVNIEQIRRVKKKYETEQSSGMNAKDLTGTSKYSKSRARSSNEKTQSNT